MPVKKIQTTRAGQHTQALVDAFISGLKEAGAYCTHYSGTRVFLEEDDGDPITSIELVVSSFCEKGGFWDYIVGIRHRIDEPLFFRSIVRGRGGDSPTAAQLQKQALIWAKEKGRIFASEILPKIKSIQSYETTHYI